MDATFAFTVNSKQANRPLLQCLLPVIPYLRIDQWRSLLKPDSADGIIRVDGRIVHENIVLLSGQQVSYTPLLRLMKARVVRQYAVSAFRSPHYW